VAMTKLISDIDVNFVNELVFDYIFAGHFLSTASVVALRKEESADFNKLKRFGK
jgi:hypothetical protein